VHFLNIEYLILRVFEAGQRAFAGPDPYAYGGVGAGTSGTTWLDTASVLLGSLALIGMFLTIVFGVLLVWFYIKTLLVEHEGFEKKEEAAHAALTHGEHASHAPKNARWDRVYELASTESESDWRLAILEADIMLGDMLALQGYRGESIGERLRDANPLQFLTLDLAWKAHKMRNDIAHAGEGFHLSQRDAMATIDLYKRVFEEFNFI